MASASSTAAGEDEAVYLGRAGGPGQRGRCPADVIIEKWNGEWDRDIGPARSRAAPTGSPRDEPRPAALALALAIICAGGGARLPPVVLAFLSSSTTTVRIVENEPCSDGRLLDGLLLVGNSRLLPAATFVLNYRLGRDEPFGYHVVNFAVHVLAASRVFALALALCGTPALRDALAAAARLALAAMAGVLFACHPMQTQAVTYIVQRYASMAAMFYVWAVVCFLRARIRQAGLRAGAALRRTSVATAVLAVCAVLSKENAASLPAALLLAEWLGFGWARHRRAFAIAIVGALVVLSVPVAWKLAFWRADLQVGSWRWEVLVERLEGALLPPKSESFGNRTPAFNYLLTQATVLPRYLRLVVVPWGQNIDHDIPIAQSLSAPVLAGFAFLVALALLGLSQVRRRPFAAFAILLFFVTLSPESSVFALTDVMVEHRMYLPMAALSLAAGWLFAAGVARAPRSALSAGAVIAVGLITLTFARNVVWRSPDHALARCRGEVTCQGPSAHQCRRGVHPGRASGRRAR